MDEKMEGEGGERKGNVEMRSGQVVLSCKRTF